MDPLVTVDELRELAIEFHRDEELARLDETQKQVNAFLLQHGAKIRQVAEKGQYKYYGAKADDFEHTKLAMQVFREKGFTAEKGLHQNIIIGWAPKITAMPAASREHPFQYP